MQVIRVELAQAQARLEAATDPHAKAVLQGVVMALSWAYEDGGRTPPSELAARMVAEPKAVPKPEPAKALVDAEPVSPPPLQSRIIVQEASAAVDEKLSPAKPAEKKPAPKKPAKKA